MKKIGCDGSIATILNCHFRFGSFQVFPLCSRQTSLGRCFFCSTMTQFTSLYFLKHRSALRRISTNDQQTEELKKRRIAAITHSSKTVNNNFFE